MILNSDAKYEYPDLLVSKMACGIGWIFIGALKSENLYFDSLFFSKAYNVSARTFQRNYVSRHWRVMQNLKETWFVACKMTKGIWLMFMKAVKSLKNCTLMGCFFRDTEVWWDVLRKNESWFQKWHVEFGEF